jgi:hypothetical protein
LGRVLNLFKNKINVRGLALVKECPNGQNENTTLGKNMVDSLEGLRRLMKALVGLIFVTEIITTILWLIEIIPAMISVITILRESKNYYDWNIIFFIGGLIVANMKWLLIGAAISFVLFVICWIIMGFMGDRQNGSFFSIFSKVKNEQN